MWLPRAAPRSCSGWLTALLLGLRREYLLLPRFSLISHFASCDSGLCVPCHQFAARSRQEARETRPKVRGTAACWKAAGGCQLCCVAEHPCRGRAGGVVCSSSCQGRETLPLRALPTARSGLPQGCSQGLRWKRCTQALFGSFNISPNPRSGVRMEYGDCLGTTCRQSLAPAAWQLVDGHLLLLVSQSFVC